MPIAIRYSNLGRQNRLDTCWLQLGYEGYLTVGNLKVGKSHGLAKFCFIALRRAQALHENHSGE